MNHSEERMTLNPKPKPFECDQWGSVNHCRYAELTLEPRGISITAWMMEGASFGLVKSCQGCEALPAVTAVKHMTNLVRRTEMSSHDVCVVASV